MGLPVDQNITVVGLDKIGKIFLSLGKEKKLCNELCKKIKYKNSVFK